MNLGKLLLITGVVAAYGIVALPTADADEPGVVSVARLGAPGAITPQKRTLKLAAALKAIGVTQGPPQTLDMRLTPMSPRAGGAAITRTGLVVMQGADGAEPDGSYALMRGGAIALSSVEMRFPTEAGKLYVVDCRVRLPQGSSTKLTLTRGASTGSVTVDDGHVFSAFSATSTTSPIVVGAVAGASDTSAVMAYFYGCDVGKAN